MKTLWQVRAGDTVHPAKSWPAAFDLLCASLTATLAQHEPGEDPGLVLDKLWRIAEPREPFSYALCGISHAIERRS